MLVDNGHDVNHCVETYGTALAIAALHHNDDAALVLLKSGADPNLKGEGYYKPLNAACQYLSVDTVRAFLDAGAEISGEPGRETALHAAANTGNLSIVQLLVERGADVNAPGGVCGTPLKAAIQSRNEAIFQLLLDSGADINARGSCSTYPIDQAIWSGNLQAADKLLELGGQFGEEALESALDYHEKEYLVKILLDKGANPNAPQKDNGNILQYAAMNSGEQAKETMGPPFKPLLCRTWNPLSVFCCSMEPK
ncbi:hypothetical protein FRC15_005711 [Serendipita sp. 397]|nr:hypothetical protein FRC15_005711 [Serendipita sp. 397]